MKKQIIYTERVTKKSEEAYEPCEDLEEDVQEQRQQDWQSSGDARQSRQGSPTNLKPCLLAFPCEITDEISGIRRSGSNLTKKKVSFNIHPQQLLTKEEDEILLNNAIQGSTQHELVKKQTLPQEEMLWYEDSQHENLQDGTSSNVITIRERQIEDSNDRGGRSLQNSR